MNTRNNMKMTSIAAALSLVGCLASGAALAQGASLSPAGGYNPSWYLIPSVNGFDPDSDFGTDHRGPGVGLRLGKYLSPAWDVQFGTTFSRSHPGNMQYRQNMVGADALYMFSRNRFRPFLLMGGGAEFDKVNGPNMHTAHTSPYVNLGIGAQYSFNEQWGMQADVRRTRSFLHGNDFGFDHANTNIATLGVTYSFGKVATAAPAPAPTPIVSTATPPPPQATPVAKPVTPVVTPPPAPRFERYTLSSTELFEFDRSELRMPQPKLDEIADVLNRKPEITSITITGYTDRLGSEKYNMKLSQRRADSVKTYLSDKGVNAGRLSAVAKGESNPVVECSEKNRSALIKCLEPNRRVEVEEFVIERRIP